MADQFARRARASYVGTLLAVAVLSLALATAPATAAAGPRRPRSAANTVSGTDGSGDASNGDDCHADILSFDATYTASAVTLSVTLACGADPTTDVGWTNGFTGAQWALAVDGPTDNFIVDINGSGGFHSQVSYQNDAIPDSAIPMCDPTPAWDGQTTYSVSFPPSCIDDAGSFSLHVFAFAGPHTDNGPNEGTVGPISVMEPAPAPPRNTGYPHACNGAPDFFADAGPAADCLHAWKIAFGKADGTFGEIDSLLRSQVSSLLARLLTTNGVSLTATRSFPDVNPDTVPNAQVRDEIEHLAGAGIIAGFPNGTFGPAGSLSNAQAATFLMRTLQFLHSQQPSIPSFTAAATTIRNYVHVLRVFILDVGATAQDGGDYAVGSTDQTQRGLLADMICQALERMGKALQ